MTAERLPSKLLIVQADDLGLSKAFNIGILEAATQGFLTSTCVRVNGSAYEHAVEEIIPQCPHLGLGVHLNLVEGKTTRRRTAKSSQLYYWDGTYRLGHVGLQRRRKDKVLLHEIEADYRDQIEIAQKIGPLDHLNSHQHSHGIPDIFEIVCRLAKEYGIRYIRLPQEKLYYAAPFSRHMHSWYALNLLKVAVLNRRAKRNRTLARNHGVLTNDWFIGVAYTGYMDDRTVREGLRAVGKQQGIVEILLHPAQISADPEERYLTRELRNYVIQAARSIELKTVKSRDLLSDLRTLGFTLTNYKRLSQKHLSPITIKVQSPDTQIKKKASFSGFLIIDETPFYHPEYARRLIQECEEMEIQGAALVKLPSGGVLKRYLLKNWRELGIRELVLLGLQQALLRFYGNLPRFLRGDFDASVQSVLERFQIPYRVVSKVNTPEFLSYVEAFAPDIILSSNSLIFGEKLIRSAKVACINRHSALLPTCGGILPVFRAVQLGHKFSGASVHHVVKTIDGGRVISRKWLPLFPGDTLNQIYRLCFVLSFEATREALNRLQQGDASEEPIDPGLKESYFSYPSRDDWSEFRKKGGRFI